jgi:hypothetical protein
MNYNENLQNDSLLHQVNEYIHLIKDLKLQKIYKVKSFIDNGLCVIFHYEDSFVEWAKNQNLEIEKSFVKLVNELNQKKIFFFGCSFDNFKHNYDKRLEMFLENFWDASEYDFITGELEFLDNILHEIQNSEGVHENYLMTDFSNSSKAYDIFTRLGSKQYLFSHNKKIKFLNECKAKLFSNDSLIIESIFRQKTIHSDSQDSVDQEQNNLLNSTIEDYLEEFKNEINGNGYDILVNALNEYFSNGSFPVLKSKINFKRINKKRVGWALKELYKSEKTDKVGIEYFRFAQENINLFEKEIIYIENFNKSNFYKAFTTNPAK